MKLIIKIEDNLVQAILEENDRIIDKNDFKLDNNLSQKLLPTIDELLKKNKLDIKDIKKAELDCNVPNSYTTYRIAKVVVNVINQGLDKI